MQAVKQASQRSIEEILKNALSTKYHNIRFFKQGGTRTCFLAEWGDFSQQRIIKVDAPPRSRTAERHVERGCTTRREIEMLSRMRSPEQHYVVQLLDYVDLPQEGIIISVEPYFPSSSLEERIKRSVLSTHEFHDTFLKILEATRYLLRDNHLYHRDLKPSNILIADNGDVRVTDFANACETTKSEPKELPTAGGHFVFDPLIAQQFTGNQGRYTEAAEIYALGVNMYYALTGKYIFEFDPEKGTAIATSTGESVLEERRLDMKKYEKILYRALAQLSWRQRRRYKEILKRCLTSDRQKRYLNIDDLISDFKEKEEMRLKTVYAGTIGFFLVAMFGLGVAAYMDEKPAPPKTYEVASAWDGSTLEVTNNIVRLDAAPYVIRSPRSVILSSRGYLEVNPGERIDVNPQLQQMALPSNIHLSFAFGGSTYIEGYDAEDFFIYAAPNDKTALFEAHAEVGSKFVSLNVPKNITEGTHILAVEIYAPEKEEVEVYEHVMVKYVSPGHVLARKRIPIVIGKPAQIVDINHVRTEPFDMSFRRKDSNENVRNVKHEITYFDHTFAVLSRQQPAQEKNRRGRFDFKEGKVYLSDFFQYIFPPDEGTVVMRIISTDTLTGQRVYETYIPFTTSHVANNYFQTRLSIPDMHFKERLRVYHSR